MVQRDVIDRIRTQTDLVAYIGETVKLTKRGRSYLGLCPFHQEKSPSFTVSLERGIFHCFGCKASGDIFKFMELSEGLTFGEALHRLADRLNITLDEDRSHEDRAADDRAKRQKEELYAINAIAASFFEEALLSHPDGVIAQEELARRGLPIPQTTADEANSILRSFRVGYAPSGWDHLARHLKSKGISPQHAEQLGLLAARQGGGYYDGFRHRLMVAIIDTYGHVVAFSGRSLRETKPDQREQTDNRATPKYVNSKESIIYSKGNTLFGLYQAKNAIRTNNEAIIVEGNFDLIAMHVRGFQNVIAPMGTAFTPEQAKMLRRFTQQLILLFDADNAGKKATWASRPICQSADLLVRVARLSHGKDPDEMLQKLGAEAMKAALDSARSLDEYLIDDVCEGLGEGSSLTSKKQALDQIRPILQEQKDTVLREMLSRRVSQRLGLDHATLWRDVSGRMAESHPATLSYQSKQANQTAAKPVEHREEERLSKAIVEQLFAFPDLAEDEEVIAFLGVISGDWALAVASLREEMRNSRRENRPMNGASLLAQLPHSIHETAAAKLVTWGQLDSDHAENSTPQRASHPDAQADPQSIRRTILQSAAKLHKIATVSKTQEMKKQIAQAEESGDFERATQLALEEANLVREMKLLQKRLMADPSAIR